MKRAALLAGCFVVACGGDTAPHTSDGGNGGGAGGRSSNLGGTGGSIPARGAVAETIQPAAGGPGCSASSPEFTAPPNVDPVSGTHASLYCDLSASTGCSPTSNIVVDGDQDASVTCTLSGSGPFNVSATISKGDVGFSISGTLSDAGGKAFVSSSHAQRHLQDAQCDITIEPNQGQIKSGAIWAAFDCTVFSDISAAEPPGCTASGKFIFENCGK